MNGVFSLPHEPIGNIDPSRVYFYDKMQDNHPQIYNWRFWCWQAPNFIEELSKNGMRVTDKISD